jgi:hypothetical protein
MHILALIDGSMLDSSPYFTLHGFVHAGAPHFYWVIALCGQEGRGSSFA